MERDAGPEFERRPYLSPLAAVAAVIGRTIVYVAAATLTVAILAWPEEHNDPGVSFRMAAPVILRNGMLEVLPVDPDTIEEVPIPARDRSLPVLERRVKRALGLPPESIVVRRLDWSSPGDRTDGE